MPNLGEHDWTLVFTAAFAALFGGLLLYLCSALASDRRERSHNFLLAVLGAVVGWALGMFFSPFDAADVQRFNFLGTAIATFISGYVLSKIDPLIAALVKRATDSPTEVPWARCGLFLAAALLSSVVVFVNRTYAPRLGAPAGQAGTPQR
jgi:MFS family permease